MFQMFFSTKSGSVSKTM